ALLLPTSAARNLSAASASPIERMHPRQGRAAAARSRVRMIASGFAVPTSLCVHDDEWRTCKGGVRLVLIRSSGGKGYAEARLLFCMTSVWSGDLHPPPCPSPTRGEGTPEQRSCGVSVMGCALSAIALSSARGGDDEGDRQGIARQHHGEDQQLD